MKAVVQRVTNASVTVDGEVISEIGKGYLVLLGVGKEDDEQTCERIVKKLIGLRIFEDSEGKTNLSLGQVDGSLLIVSQFTLYADCRKGNRPSFIEAGPPEMAERLYEYFISLCEKDVKNVGRGKFGGDMKVALTNDGPFTVILE